MASHNHDSSGAPAAFETTRNETLTNIVDYRARKTPQALYAEFPISATSYDAGYRKVNYAQLANAVDGAAWWLNRTLGPGKNFETLAYIGPNDLRYNVLILGAVKAGYKMLLSSPRNSVAAHAHLFNLLDCKIMVTVEPRQPMISAILAGHPLQVLNAPDVTELLSGQHPSYPYHKTFEEAKNEPLLAFHTSGSTGLPKPIVWSHAFAASYINMIQMDPPDGFESQDRLFQANRMFFMLPPFHAANHVSTLCNAIANRTAWIYPLAGALPSAKILADGLRHTKADGALISPPIAAEMSKDPDLLEFICSNLDTIVYAGGDVPAVFGAPITNRVKFLNIYGSSEQGNIAELRPEGEFPSDDWKYINFHPRAGLDFRHVDEDLYELWMVKDSSFEDNQPVFKLYPHLSAFGSGDLFSPHPTKPNLWTHRGRSDDIIVFLTGEKTNPISMEDHIGGHPDVKAALVHGTLKFQAALMIELIDARPLSTTEKAEVIERIWPTIQEANQHCPAHAKIARSHILIVDPQKPMARAGKGTVQRRPTMDSYAEELEALYADGEKIELVSNGTVATRPLDLESVSALIRNSITIYTGWTTLQDGDNIYLMGVDSLQTLLLTRDLRQALGIAALAPSTVYTNPSISQLAQAILRLSAADEASLAAQKEKRKIAIDDALEQHKAVIDEFAIANTVVTREATAGTENQKNTIILTGSTGALGSYILQTLIESPSVAHVYCLNRAHDSSVLQEKRNKIRNLSTTFPDSKVTFLTADLAQPYFALSHEVYEQLLQSTTHIILNAWPVNFNIPLSAFQPQITSITNVAKFASQGHSSPSVFFLSSVSSILGSRETSVPEDIITSHSAPASMGYGESKYIAERLLDYAASKLSITASVARIGQIAGPAHIIGPWNKQEWLPSLIISSAHIGSVPDSLGFGQSEIDWIPIDLLAGAIVELAIDAKPKEPSGKATVFHPVNPNATTWEAILPTIVKKMSMSTKRDVDIVPFAAWLQKVKKAYIETSGEDIERMTQVNPAVKLISTYETLLTAPALVLETSNAKRASEKLRNIEAIKPQWVEGWYEGWLEN